MDRNDETEDNKTRFLRQLHTRDTYTIDEARDFLASMSTINDNGCCIWQGSRTKGGTGYGQVHHGLYRAFGIRGAHRLSYFLSTGYMPVGRHEQVMHECDVPACINPAHLTLGTPKQNSADMYAKGRQRQVVGVDHPNAKLGDNDIRAIRARYLTGELQTALAAEFDVSQSRISDILNRRVWKHLD